jgi:hypothetical protein
VEWYQRRIVRRNKTAQARLAPLHGAAIVRPEVAKARTPSLSDLIERTDNFGSLVFAFGFLLVVMAVTSLFLTGVVFGLGYAISEWVFGPRYRTAAFWTVFAVALLPMMVAGLLDARLGPKLPREHWVSRTFRAVFRSMMWLTAGRLTTPMLLTFTSHVGRRKGMVIVIGTIYLLLAWVVVDVLVRKGELGIDNYAWLPKPGGARQMDPRNYLDQRTGSARFSTRPHIGSEVVRGRYLKLMIPYAPDRHAPALASGCTGAAPTAKDDVTAETARREALLNCVAALHTIKLDGQPLPDLALDFYSDSKTGLRGMAAFIPVADLAPGRHELEVSRLPRATDDAKNREEIAANPDRIPFWR